MQGRQFQTTKDDEVLSYLVLVKHKFGNQEQMYEEFLAIMKGFRYRRIDGPTARRRISNLFKGYPELIAGFNTILPHVYRIHVKPNVQVPVSIPSKNVDGGATSSEAKFHATSAIAASIRPTHSSQSNYSFPSSSPHSSTGSTVNSARVNPRVSFLDQVKYKFHDKPEVYKELLSIITAVQTRSVGPLATIHRVSCLFRGQPELIEGFKAFLPPECRIDIQPTEQVQVNIPGMNRSGCTTSSPSLTAFPSESAPIHTTRSSQSNHSNPTTSSLTSPESMISVGYMQDWLPFLHQVRNKFHDQPGVYSEILSIITACETQSINVLSTIHRVSCLFRGQPELIKGFKAILLPK